MDRFDVAPDGDLVLVVAGTTEIRVYSNMLCLVSSVFKAMLGPDFAEGIALASKSSADPLDLQLPDDDPEGMKLLAAFLHHRVELRNGTPQPRHVFQLVRMADKYNCMAIFQSDCERWLGALDVLDFQNQGALLKALFLMDNARLFSDFTDTLAFRAKDDDFSQDEGDTLQTEILSAVRKKREELYNKICHEIDGIVDNMAVYLAKEHYVDSLRSVDEDLENYPEDDGPVCDYWKKAVVVLMPALTKASLWPASTRPSSVHGLFERVKALPSHELPDLEPNNQCCFHDERFWEHSTVAILRNIRSLNAPGLCLDCFKAKRSQVVNASRCRIPHKKLRDYQTPSSWL